ncbi:VOC family protein [Hasllibacter halocynthiae]|uniref:VOC family protein n=1 Tax=Hasllibacter halocynthiae TaxID=595589 RepID=UPI000D07D09A|nr:VOC family protein [Hasllibacter halocynthiae]
MPAIGHVHLKVSDLDRAIAFYGLLGLSVQARYGAEAAFLSWGGYHHHLGLNTWRSKGAAPAPEHHPGLFHAAFLFEDRPALARAVRAVTAAGHPLAGASDHGVSEAVYLSDPDGNGVELCRDRPRAEWPRCPDGSLAMTTEPLDLAALLAEGG